MPTNLAGQQFDVDVGAAVATARATWSNASLVNMYPPFNATLYSPYTGTPSPYMADILHPNQAGGNLMAPVWYNGILAIGPVPPAGNGLAWTLATTADWSLATNWNGGAVPTFSDTATCTNGGTVSITQTGATCNVLSLGSSTGSGTVQMSPARRSPRTTSSWAIPAAALSRSRAGPTRLASYGLLYIGGNSINNTTGTGTYNLNAGSLSVPYEYVGQSGTGTFTQIGRDQCHGVPRSRLAARQQRNLQPRRRTAFPLRVGVGLGSGGLNLNGGTLQINSACTIAQPLLLNTSGGTFAINTAGNTVTLAGALSGTGGLTETGGGTLIVSNTNNTCSGSLTVNSGTLQLSNSATAQTCTVAVNSANGLAFGPGFSTSSSKTYSVYVGALAGGGSVNLASLDSPPVPLLLFAGGNNASTIFSGSLTGSGSFTKTGNGTLTLTGSSNNAGGITLAGGTLDIDGPAALGNGPFTITGGSIGNSSGAALDVVHHGGGVLEVPLRVRRPL